VRFETPQPLRFTTGFPGLPEGKPSPQGRRAQARAFKAALRRKAQLRAAAEVLPHLPGPGESVHALLTGSFDFMLVLTCVIQARPAVCEHLRVTTLAFSRRNTQELARLLDSARLARLTLLTSDFMARSNAAVYQGAVEELAAARKQTVASARCHAKVACLAFADGLRLVFEGSANLRTNKNWEQMTAINDAGLHDWHAGWIDAKVREHEIHQSRTGQTG
jgi:hypothetical protein